MTVAELMALALNELNEDSTTVTSVGWTPNYWDYSSFRNYTLKAIRDTARDCSIELKPVTLTATVFYDTELDSMPAIGNDIITYRLYPTPTEAIDDSATSAYFYILSDTYEPKNFRFDDTQLVIKSVEDMDNEFYNWRDDSGSPLIAVVEGVTQSTTGSTTPDHSDDYTVTASVQQYQTFATDSVEITLPEKLEEAMVFSICARALRKIGIEEDQNRSQLYEMRYREEVRRYNIDNLSGRIPTVRPDGLFP